MEEEQVQALDENKSDVEIVQAPIIGRKKKTKKPAATPKPTTATVNKSHPASPGPTLVEEKPAEVVPAGPKKTQAAKASARVTPEPEPMPEPPKEKREHTAQSIIADLQKTGELLVSTLEFFKPLSSSLTHTSRAAQPGNPTAPPDLKIHFSEADLDALAKKKPVRLNGHDGKPDSRTLITPNGKFFWGLSEELEQKALELEKRIEDVKGHGRFHPHKQTRYTHTHTQPSAAQTQSKDALPAIATALKEADKKLSNQAGHQMPKLDSSSGLVGSTSLPLGSAPAPEMPAPQPPQPQAQQQTPADAGGYLNQFVLPQTDNPPPNQPRPEMAAVGGPPGAGTANMSVNVGKFAKAAKAVVEGGAVGSTEIDGMGMMAADLLGGVFVQGLEALVGAGLGLQSSQEFGLDAHGNVALGRGGLDVQGLMSAIESGTGMAGFGTGNTGASAGHGRRGGGRGSVLSLEEAEQAMHAARKEHDVLEKKLAALMKKNKKLAMAGATGKA